MKKQHTNTSSQKYLELVCADVLLKKLYVTSGTMKRSKERGSGADTLLNEFKARYPFFAVEVNDAFFLKMLGDCPA